MLAHVHGPQQGVAQEADHAHVLELRQPTDGDVLLRVALGAYENRLRDGAYLDVCFLQQPACRPPFRVTGTKLHPRTYRRSTAVWLNY